MRIIKQQLEVLYFRFKLLGALQIIVHNIFSTLPLFWAPNVLRELQQVETCLYRAKLILQQSDGELKNREQTLNVEQKSNALSGIIVQLIKDEAKLAKSLGKVAKQMLRVTVGPWREFCKQFAMIAKVRTEIAAQCDAIQRGIESGCQIIYDVRSKFEDSLKKLVYDTKKLWFDLYRELAKIRSIPIKERYDSLQSFLPKDLQQQYLGYLQQIEENRFIIGGGKWLVEVENEGENNEGGNVVNTGINKWDIVLLLHRILKPECVEQILSRLAELFSSNCKHFLDQMEDELKEFFCICDSDEDDSDDECNDYYDYKDALHLQKKIIFIQGWLHILEAKSKEVFQKNPQSLSFVLAAKNLIYSLKNRYYYEFYHLQSKKQRKANTIISLHNMLERAKQQNNHISQKFIFDKLEQRQEELDKKIAVIEEQLKNHSWGMGIISTGIRLWTESFYFRWAKGFVSAGDEASTKFFGEEYFLGTKLSEGHINFWSNTLTGAIVSADLYSSKLFGSHYTLLSIFSHFLLSDLNKLVCIAREMGIGRKQVLDNLSKIEIGLGLFILLGFNFFAFGPSIAGLCYSSGSYLSGVFGKTIIQHLLQNFNKNIFASESDTAQTHLFMRVIIGHGGYVGATLLWKHCYLQAYAFFKPLPTAGELLNNSKLCLKHKKNCKKTAAKILGIRINATTLPEVRKKWRQLALQHHPDRAGEDGIRLFAKLNTAKDRLIELAKAETGKKLKLADEKTIDAEDDDLSSVETPKFVDLDLDPDKELNFEL